MTEDTDGVMELEMTENETDKHVHGWFVVKSLAATVATAARPWNRGKTWALETWRLLKDFQAGFHSPHQ